MYGFCPPTEKGSPERGSFFSLAETDENHARRKDRGNMKSGKGRILCRFFVKPEHVRARRRVFFRKSVDGSQRTVIKYFRGTLSRIRKIGREKQALYESCDHR